ncbi:MAG: hypothetical protein RJA77_880 [Pseudomonadota bacterium]
MRYLIVLIWVSMGLQGCSTPAFIKDAADWVVPSGDKIQWRSLQLQPQVNANQNSPIAIDLVLALDQITADKLEALTGAQWHAQREALLPGLQGMVVIRRFELTPGNGLQMTESDLPKERAMRVLVFAHMKAETPGRLRLNPKVRQVVIEIGETDLSLRTDPSPRP